jgi:pimeloyl-ACP methyl ester carboxylesterase
VPRAPLVLSLLLACTREPSAIEPPAAPAPAAVAAPKDLPVAPAPERPVPQDLPEQPPPTPLPLRHHSVLADGHPIAVHGKRGDRPWGAVVLVHGRTWSSLPDFDLQVPGARVSLMDNLAAEGLAVYAVDLRGYGGTARDASGWNSPARAVDDLAAVLRYVHEDTGLPARPAVLGWSLGARVAALTAQRHPDLASAIVLYGTPCHDPHARPSTPMRDPAAPGRKPNTEAAARSDFITPGAVEPAVVDAFARTALAADPVRADWRDTHEWTLVEFTRIRAPVLAIHGDRDPVVDAACVRARLAEARGPTALEVLPGADHAAHLETAGPRFVAAVAAFLKKHVPAG